MARSRSGGPPPRGRSRSFPSRAGETLANAPDDAARRFRGSVARKGARVVATPDDGRRRAADRPLPSGEEQPAWEPEVWIDDGVDPEARPTTGASPEPEAPAVRARTRHAIPEAVQAELHDAVDRSQAARVGRRLAEAIKAYERDRYEDALRTLRPVARLAPTSPTIRELHGLTLYRLGKWRAAIKELEAFHALTGSFDQHPVLIDCHRAGGRWAAAERLWEQLRKSSPAPEVLTEGRIVIAAARADRGDLAGAIELLELARTKERPPPLHHLRLWFALADLHERAGNIPRARALFTAVVDHEPMLFDTAQRLAALR